MLVRVSVGGNDNNSINERRTNNKSRCTTGVALQILHVSKAAKGGIQNTYKVTATLIAHTVHTRYIL